MSLFGRYVDETRGIKIVEGQHGFATYIIVEKECYLEDMYVDADYRHCGVGTKIVDQIKKIAKDAGCLDVTTTINCKFKNPTLVTLAALSYGFKIFKVVEDIIIMKVET